MIPLIKHGLPAEFGNGSDGALVVTSDTAMTQREYNFTELSFTGGGKLYAPVATDLSDYFPYVIIRCQTPIYFLQGGIDVSGIMGELNYATVVNGTGGASELVQGDDPSHHYHITGGASGYSLLGGLLSWRTSGQALIGYSGDLIAAQGHGSSVFSGTPGDEIPKWVGPNRLYRFALGGIGQQGHNENTTPDGGRGGGCLEIWAPDVILYSGFSTYINAKGADGEDGDDEGGGYDAYGAGGGGGGCVMIFTASDRGVDLSRVNVSRGDGGVAGPSGGAAGGDGLDGMKFWRQINGY